MLRSHARQTLVAEAHRHACGSGNGLGPLACLDRLRTFAAVHVKRQTDDQSTCALFDGQTNNSGNIVGDVLSTTERCVRHGGPRFQIAERNADAALPEVDAHDAPGRAWGPVSNHSHQLAVGLAEGDAGGVREASGDADALADGVGEMDAGADWTGAMVAVCPGPGPFGAVVAPIREPLAAGPALACPVGVTI
jgi:hypothetical protein